MPTFINFQLDKVRATIKTFLKVHGLKASLVVSAGMAALEAFASGMVIGADGSETKGARHVGVDPGVEPVILAGKRSNHIILGHNDIDWVLVCRHCPASVSTGTGLLVSLYQSMFLCRPARILEPVKWPLKLAYMFI